MESASSCDAEETEESLNTVQIFLLKVAQIINSIVSRCDKCKIEEVETNRD
jgi:hypothetical protein